VIGGDWRDFRIGRSLLSYTNINIGVVFEIEKSVGACKTYNINTVEGKTSATVTHSRQFHRRPAFALVRIFLEFYRRPAFASSAVVVRRTSSSFIKILEPHVH